MNLINSIKLAIVKLFGRNQIIQSLETRVADLEDINALLRTAHEMDTVNLRNALAAQADAIAKAREDDSDKAWEDDSAKLLATLGVREICFGNNSRNRVTRKTINARETRATRITAEAALALRSLENTGKDKVTP